MCTSPARSPTRGDRSGNSQSLTQSAREAEIIAEPAGHNFLPEPSQAARTALQDRVVAEMTATLWQAATRAQPPDGVAYILIDQAQLDLPTREDTLACMRPIQSAPMVEEVLRFADLPVGSSASRCAVVRWSDGTEGQALAWIGDEILICEGDLLGKTQDQLRSLHFRRDRDWLQF